MSADWALPPLRPGHPADAGLVERRARAGGDPAAADGLAQEEIGGLRCLLVEPAGGAGAKGGEDGEGDLLYLHGGGYRLGSPHAYIAFARDLAARSGRRIVLPFYPLAPEHPFPAALHAVSAVFRALPDPEATVIAGDSAGGGLTAALCLLAARAGQRPAGAILLSPMLDLAAGADSLERNATRDPLFSKAAVIDAAGLYLQGHDPADPLVSAIHADPALFPPLLVLTGSAEVLLDEALDFARKCALADARVSLHVAPGMGHVWPLLAAGTPAANEAMQAMADFAKARGMARTGGSA